MDMTGWERRTLQQIEIELTADAPRLARRLRAPALRDRLMWGPRRARIALGSVALLLACGALVLASALTSGPVPQR